MSVYMNSRPPGRHADSAFRNSSWLNLAAYQLGWFACVLGAARGWEGLGAGIAIVLAAGHVGLAERPDREWPLLLSAAFLGLLIETLQAGFGVLDLPGHQPGSIAPLWIVALWLQFGTVLHFCLRWISGRYLLASLLGLLGGPLAFLSGERLGAASIGEPRALSLAVLGLTWAVSFPTLVLLADRLGGVGRYRIFSSGNRPAGEIATTPVSRAPGRPV